MPYVPPEPPVPFSMPYTGERLRWAIDVMGWSYNYFGERLGIGHSSLRQMFRNNRYIPDALAFWVETMAQLHLTFPAPLGWVPKPPEAFDRYGYDPVEIVSPDTIALDTVQD